MHRIAVHWKIAYCSQRNETAKRNSKTNPTKQTQQNKPTKQTQWNTAKQTQRNKVKQTQRNKVKQTQRNTAKQTQWNKAKQAQRPSSDTCTCIYMYCWMHTSACSGFNLKCSALPDKIKNTVTWVINTWIEPEL